MREHSLDFGGFEPLDETARHGNRVVALAQPRGIGIECRRLDDFEPRHGYAARNAEVFEHVVELGGLLARDSVGSGRGADHGAIAEEGDHEPARRDEHRERPRRPELFRRCPEDVVEIAAAERIYDQQDRELERMQEDNEAREQDHGPDTVRADVRVEAVGAHN